MIDAKNVNLRVGLASGVFCALMLALPVLAQTAAPGQGLLDDKWVLNLGAFVVGTELNANLNGRSVDNPEIDFDETFGRRNDATRLRADALWRITPAHHLRLMYFNNSTSRSRVIDESITWGDYEFQAGGNVGFRYEFQIFEAAYEYAFVRQPNYEIAGSIGVHYSDLTLQLSGNATVTDGAGNSKPVAAATKTSSVPAPLPVVGLRAAWVVAPQWVIDAQAQYFQVKYKEYEGSWSDLRVGATWMFHRNVGLGLGYNRFATKLNVEKDSFDGRLRTGYSGLQAYLTGSF